MPAASGCRGCIDRYTCSLQSEPSGEVWPWCEVGSARCVVAVGKNLLAIMLCYRCSTYFPFCCYAPCSYCSCLYILWDVVHFCFLVMLLLLLLLYIILLIGVVNVFCRYFHTAVEMGLHIWIKSK